MERLEVRVRCLRLLSLLCFFETGSDIAGLAAQRTLAIDPFLTGDTDTCWLLLGSGDLNSGKSSKLLTRGALFPVPRACIGC